MSTVFWRIAPDAASYEAHDLSGTGAAKSGGRWNSAGRPVVYASTSISLAALETVVHLDGPPLNRYLVRIEVPDDVAHEGMRFNPAANVGWDALPPSITSVAAGDHWLASATSAILFVPSVIIPEEMNVLINPVHPDAGFVSAIKVRRFLYDPRLRLRDPVDMKLSSRPKRR